MASDTTNVMDTADAFVEARDFSLVLGGPIYQLLRRARLSDDGLQLVQRRILAGSLITWLPLLVLSAWQGTAWAGPVAIPFLYDLESHARFLITLPLLIMAELVVNQRMRGVIKGFLDRDLISDQHRGLFTEAIESATRLRNSLPAEVLLIAIVYGLGSLGRDYVAVGANTWAVQSGRFTMAGWWNAFVSHPIFQFVLLRWYFRLIIWMRFLWHVSRIELRLIPTHPDRAGGLGFLGNVAYAFAPLLLAHGTLLAGFFANRIFYLGAKLPQFTVEIVLTAAALVFAVLCPLMVFMRQLERARRVGLAEYGVLAQRYVREFDTKWLRSGAAGDEPLVGTADIQSLADLANSFDVIRTMRVVPFSKETVLQLAVITVLPLLPLTLTMISFEDLLKRLLTAVF
jgi:hypothetical protein